MTTSLGVLSGGNSDYTMEFLEVGEWNKLAYFAAREVVENPGKRFSPFYLCGTSGLGKTHLARAICHSMRTRNSSTDIIYVSGRSFVEDFDKARACTVEALRDRYRRCEVLVVDDVEGIADSRQSQREFLEIFSALHDLGRQIVLTSAFFPADLRGFDNQLTSRFGQGLVADIKTPNIEARMDILRHKIKRRNMTLSEEVARFVASMFSGSVCALEGALLRLSAHCPNTDQPITLSDAQQALGGLAQWSKEQLSSQEIQQVVADYYYITVADLRGSKRPSTISTPRQIAMYLTRKLKGLSYQDIGQCFGGKHHTSVITAWKRISARILKDANLSVQVTYLESTLKNSTRR